MVVLGAITTTTTINLTSTTAAASSGLPPIPPPYKQPSLLLLDVDNTLYDEGTAGIEAQIIQRTHAYCHQRLQVGLDQDNGGIDADMLFRRYGSTIEGLRQTVWKDASPDEMLYYLRDFYQTVYKGLDVSLIVPKLGGDDGNGDGKNGSTGYTHATYKQAQLVRRLLLAAHRPLAVASNSPSWHIRRVLAALGLARLPLSLVFTPDQHVSFPTKHDPETFFGPLEKEKGKGLEESYESVAFLDDSLHNLERARRAFPHLIQRVYHISNTLDDNENESRGDHDVTTTNPRTTLVEALLEELELVEPTSRYKFDQVDYLRAKNQVDRRSLHTSTWNGVVSELENRWNKGIAVLRIVDLGAGLLSILDLILHGDDNLGLESLPLQDHRTQGMLHYTAYESNTALFHEIHAILQTWGFQVADTVSSVETIYYHRHKNVEVHLILRDFATDIQNQMPLSSWPDAISNVPPDLIVGCCFADLLDPARLVPNLISAFHLLNRTPEQEGEDTLMYFPITFAGTTQFLPPQPFEFFCTTTSTCSSTTTAIPSDTWAFQSYSRALEKVLDHNLQPHRLIEAMEDHGAQVISVAGSDWKINPDQDTYLYETMLYFFGSTGGPQILEEGWDAPRWIRRVRTTRPLIQISNQDLLFRMPSMEAPNVGLIASSNSQTADSAVARKAKEILFTEPYKVTTMEKDLPKTLGPRQVLIRSSYSLISSGTELNIFKGSFDNNAPLDVNIQDMQKERMAYPLAYGYCLVGHVVECGSEVSKEEYLGAMVFTFSPHATHVVTDVDAIQVVPQGIAAVDAIFMPSIETALSLVHDAHVRLGENVAIYGQGLIGLLVTALLSRSGTGSHVLVSPSYSCDLFGCLTVFDRIPERLAVASQLGASQALLPGSKNTSKLNFDVAIEVSGNARALQAAIDQTMDGGRIIVGSWYGNCEVPLQLGIDFHRSRKTIQTSQVSEIPAALSRLWTKQRRFALAWQLVKELRPSQRRLLTRRFTLDGAQAAYEALDAGTEIAVAFDYNDI